MKGYGMLVVNKAGWMEKPVPELGSLDALIRPIALAPCTSDIHVYHGGAGPKENLILGHEAVGVVEKVGADVQLFQPGDRVLVPTTTPNWLLPEVQGRHSTHDTGVMGSFKFVGQRDGTFSEYFSIKQADANLVDLPHDVAPEAALMAVDMMSTGFHGAELANIRFGDSVVVIGAGPVGLMAVAAAKLHGAGKIILVEVVENRIAIAKEYGATDVVSFLDKDYMKQIMSMTYNGPNAVIVAGGNVSTLADAITMTRPGGTVANLVFYDPTDVFQIPALSWGLGMSNIDIRGGFCPGGALRMRKMLEIIKHHRMDPTKIITHRFHGFDAIPEAFKLMEEKPEGLIKPVILMDE